jgi:dUTP pyrophosphatase
MEKENMDKLGIELLDSRCLPEQHGDWIDLKTSEDTFIPAGHSLNIPLGVKIAIPEGKEAYLLPRSSTFRKFNIIQTNSMGIIDNGYGDEWMLPVYAMRDAHIPAHTRIAQFRVVDKMKTVEMYLTDMVKEGKDRHGFGSTDGAEDTTELERLIRKFLK